MPSIAEMRAKIKATQKSSGGQDTAIYPFWNLKPKQSATFRFLPWEDPVTQGIWTEKKMLPMKFLDPQDDSKTITYKAPCREMYSRDATCAVTNVVRDLYKEVKQLESDGDAQAAEELKKIAGSHWVKPSAYYQGFVNASEYNEQDVPENPIRIFVFNKKIHTPIYSAIMDEKDPFDKLPSGEFTLEEVRALAAGELSEDEAAKVFDKMEGYDFILRMTKQGEWNNYDTSSFSRKPTSLTDEQIEAVVKYGLHDLTKKLPEEPSDEQYEVLVEMMKVSIAKARGDDDGFWNPEWEEAGIKPYRGGAKKDAESEDEDGASKTTTVGKASGGTASKFSRSNTPAKEEAKPASTASSALSRFKKQEAPAVKSEAPAEEAATSNDGSKATSIADKIRARVNAAAAKKAS